MGGLSEVSEACWEISKKEGEKSCACSFSLLSRCRVHFFFYARACYYASLVKCTWFLLVDRLPLPYTAALIALRPRSHPSLRASGPAGESPPQEKTPSWRVLFGEGHLAGATTHAPQPLLPPPHPLTPAHPRHNRGKTTGPLLLPRTRRHPSPGAASSHFR